MRQIKDFLKNIPILGNVLEKLYIEYHKLSPDYLYTYLYKPWILPSLLRKVRVYVRVGSLSISSSSIVVHTGVAKFHWDPGDAYSLLGYPLRGSFEEDETLVAIALSGISKIVVDVGGNFGWYTCHILGSLPPGGEIHVFEPGPTSCNELRRNIDINKREEIRVTVNECCLSADEGSAVLHIPDISGPAFASLRHQKSLGKSTEYPIRSTTLDKYCADKGIRAIDLLKIDVEGAESLVLEGARGILLSESRPAILIELQDSTLTSFGKTRRELIDLIVRYGYHGYIFGTTGGLYDLNDPGKKDGYNYLFLPRSSAYDRMKEILHALGKLGGGQIVR